MSKNKARKPDGAKKGPASSSTKVLKVGFEFHREYRAELTLAVPKNTSKADLVEILDDIESDYTFDDFQWDNEYNVANSLTVDKCETLDRDKAEADFVATRDGDAWRIEQVAAQ